MAAEREVVGREIASPASRWTQRRDIALALLAWIALAGVVVWAASHVVRSIILIVIAGLIAYALYPAVRFLSRFLPRWLAIIIVYLVLLGAIGVLADLIISTAIAQLTSLAKNLSDLVRSGSNGSTSPLITRLEGFGISSSQISSATQRLSEQATALAGGALPFVTSVLNGVLDTVLILVLSIYLVVDGSRLGRWLRRRAPLSYRGRVGSVIDTLQHVVGGYIRGQVTLSTLIGALVGVGMFVIGIPYAVLLGLLAFVLEFIPVIGTLTSGAICVGIALTQGLPKALIVLGYFVIVHIIEGDVVGPRIVGEAIGVHPAVSIIALVAGGELFGIWGALFAAPLAGLIQAFIADFWIEWQRSHPQQFPDLYGAPIVPVTTADATHATEAGVVAPLPPGAGATGGATGDGAGRLVGARDAIEPSAKPNTAYPPPEPPLVITNKK